MNYMKEKKEALIVLAIATPLLSYGAFSFELQGADNNFEAITVAVSLTLGLFGVIGGLIMFFTKTSLVISDKEKPQTITRKEITMNISNDITNEEPIIEGETSAYETTLDKEQPAEQPASESIRLMNEEKQLVGLILQQADELDRLKKELTACQTRLKAKGWVLTDTGELGTE